MGGTCMQEIKNAYNILKRKASQKGLLGKNK
jgi:hypothetical protein